MNPSCRPSCPPSCRRSLAAKGVSRSAPGRQRGISLIISMVLLVVVTLLALGSMRSVALQVRMSGTTQDRSLAFQAAEAALREAERRAVAALTTDFPVSGCATGFCATPAVTDTPRWLDDSFTGWRAATVLVSDNAPAPQAIIEDMGLGPNWLGCDHQIPPLPNCLTRRYRASSRSSADGRATVVVQSQIAAP